MPHTPTLDQMVQRKVRGGATPESAWALLRDLLQTVAHGDNLVHALVYQGFATERQAEKFVAYPNDEAADTPPDHP